MNTSVTNTSISIFIHLERLLPRNIHSRFHHRKSVSEMLPSRKFLLDKDVGLFTENFHHKGLHDEQWKWEYPSYISIRLPTSPRHSLQTPLPPPFYLPKTPLKLPTPTQSPPQKRNPCKAVNQQYKGRSRTKKVSSVISVPTAIEIHGVCGTVGKQGNRGTGGGRMSMSTQKQQPRTEMFLTKALLPTPACLHPADRHQPPSDGISEMNVLQSGLRGFRNRESGL